MLNGEDAKIVELLIKLSFPFDTRIWFHDYEKGYVRIDKSRNVIVLLNVDKLQLPIQNMLLKHLQEIDLSGKLLIIQGSKGKVIPTITSFLECVNLTQMKLQKGISYLFIYLLVEKNLFNYGFDAIEEKISENLLQPLLKEAESAQMLNHAIEYIKDSPDYLFFYRAGFIYDFESLVLKKKAKLDSVKAAPVSNDAVNRIIWRGEYWELCFGYEDYLLIEHNIGMLLIAHLLLNGENTYEPSSLRKTLTGESSDPKTDLNYIRTNFDRAVQKIANNEKKALKLISDSVRQNQDRYFYDLAWYLKESFKQSEEKQKTSIEFKIQFKPVAPVLTWQIKFPPLV